MISGIEFRLACRGLLLLARFDDGFQRYFDRSRAGALRSFWLALLILPYFLFQLWLEIDQTIPNGALYAAARGVGYAYGWIVFPLVILAAGRVLQREKEAPGCIAVYNWTILLWIVLQLPAEIAAGLDPKSGLATGLGLLALFANVLIEGFMLWRCLRILLWQAAALVAIDVMLTHFVIVPLFHALGGGPPLGQ
jgi:hypothetical protein